MLDTAHTTAGTWTTKVAARRDIALLCLTFAAALRRSEVAALIVGDLTVVDGADDEPLLCLRIRGHKKGRTQTTRVYIRRGGGDALRCPWCAVQRWLEIVAVCDKAAATEGRRQRRAEISDPAAVEDAVAVAVERFARADTSDPYTHRCDGAWPEAADQTAPLFRPVNNGGVPRPTALWDRSVTRVIDRRSRAAGVDRMRGHSLRAGAATEAFDRGAPVEDVMALGRWKDPATALLYDRNREQRSAQVDLGL